MIFNVDIDKVLLSNKVYFGKKGFKYSIGYKDHEKVRQLCVMLPKMSGYRRDFDETKYIFFIRKRIARKIWGNLAKRQQY